MKTLKKHNTERNRLIGVETAGFRLAGVLCDECGRELHVKDDGVVTASIPSNKSVRCFHCGALGWLV